LIQNANQLWLPTHEIIGAPTDVQGAEALKEISPHQFEWWAVDLVNARPAKDHKKGADIRQLADYIDPSASSGR
jgi:hypothetical protein